MGFPTRFDTNLAVNPQNMARGLKFYIKDIDGLHYLWSENKVANQLHGLKKLFEMYMSISKLVNLVSLHLNMGKTIFRHQMYCRLALVGNNIISS